MKWQYLALIIISIFLSLVLGCMPKDNFPSGVTFQETEFAFESIDWSPDSKMLVGTTTPLPRSGFNVSLPASEVYIWKPNSDFFEQISDQEFSYWNEDAVWHPQGVQILYYSQSEFGEGATLGMVNINSKVKEGISSFGRFGTWFPDGQKIAIENGGLFTLDVTTYTNQNIWSPSKGQEIHSLTISPDGQQIAIITEEIDSPINRIYIVSSDGKSEKLIFEATRHLNKLDWSPNGRWITFVNILSDKDVFAISVDDNCITNSLGIETIAAYDTIVVKDVKWSPDGKQLAASVIMEDRSGVFLFETSSELIIKWLESVNCN